MRGDKAKHMARQVAQRIERELIRAMVDDSTGKFEFTGEINLNQGGVNTVRTGIYKQLKLRRN